MELCGIKALSFAIGIYLPLSTTLPIFIGGAIRGIVEWRNKKKNIHVSPEEEDLGKGNLFATGLVAGGALAGVLVAFLSASEKVNAQLANMSAEQQATFLHACYSAQIFFTIKIKSKFFRSAGHYGYFINKCLPE